MGLLNGNIKETTTNEELERTAISRTTQLTACTSQMDDLFTILNDPTNNCKNGDIKTIIFIFIINIFKIF